MAIQTDDIGTDQDLSRRDIENSLESWDTNAVSSLGQKKENNLSTCQQADHRIKVKENEKHDKYLDLARELKRLWNMKMIQIPIIVKGLERKLKNREKMMGNWKSEEELKISRPQHC